MSSKMAAVQYVIPKVPDGSLCKNTVFILHHIRHITTFQRPFSLLQQIQLRVYTYVFPIRL